MWDYLALPIAIAVILSGPWILEKLGAKREFARSYPVWAAWILIVIVAGRLLLLGT